MTKSITQPVQRTPEEKDRLRQLREHFQVTKPSPDDIVAEGGELLPRAEFIANRQPGTATLRPNLIVE